MIAVYIIADKKTKRREQRRAPNLPYYRRARFGIRIQGRCLAPYRNQTVSSYNA